MMGDLSDTIIDGDPFDINEGGEGGGGFDPTSLSLSTQTPVAADEIITGESGGTWVRKTLAKMKEYFSDADNRSYVGMVIHSTTLDTEAKVKNFYGGTTWIQHSGYFLRGASSGVTANSAVKDGGQDSVTPSGTNSGGAVQSHTLTVNEIPSHRHNSWGGQFFMANYSDGAWTGGFSGGGAWSGVRFGIGSDVVKDNGGGKGHSHGFTQPTFTGDSHTNLPKYKNVYIWERTV